MDISSRHSPTASTSPDTRTLLEIIQVQTEIAKLGLDLGGVMDLVSRRAQALTGAAGAIIELAEGNEMVYRAAAGIAEPQLGLRLSRTGSLSGLCVATREILRCDDSETDSRVDREACRKVGLRSMIVVPLNHLESTVGVLKVVSPVAGAFSDADIQVLGLMSELVAAAMFHSSQLESSELYYRATHDQLTGLANRALYFDRLRQCFANAERHAERFAIFNLDMDDLKPINDECGHHAGDAALTEMAARIKGDSRKSDTVARVGGDEFGIILSRISDRGGAEKQRRRLTERISLPFQYGERALSLAASIGLAVFPDDATDMNSLLAKADESMYEVKRGRKLSRI